MSFGICLAGGGVKGSAHIGVLQALKEYNIQIDYIGGTSSGSIVSALYAMGFTPKEIYSIFKKYCNKIKYVDFFNIIKLIFGLLIKKEIIIDGLNSGKQLENLIEKMAKIKNVKSMQDIKMPLAIPSVNLYNGEVLCFTSCINRHEFSDNTRFINDIKISKAVRASCSYPVVFSPCEYNNIKLVDGGIRENVPWKELKQLGCNKVLSIVFENDTKMSCDKNFIDVASCSLNLLCRELANYEISGSDLVLKIKSEKVGLLDMKKIDQLYNLGYIQMKEFIKKEF